MDDDKDPAAAAAGGAFAAARAGGGGLGIGLVAASNSSSTAKTAGTCRTLCWIVFGVCTMRVFLVSSVVFLLKSVVDKRFDTIHVFLGLVLRVGVLFVGIVIIHVCLVLAL